MPEKLRLPTPILLALSLAVLISCKGDNNPVNGGKDTTPPTVVATNPAENAELVPIDSNISVTFSEIMDPATMTSGAFLFDPAIQGTVDYINRVFTFSHSELLSNGITYTATITTEVRDTAGNALAAEHSWQFSTFIDTFPPSIVTTDPTDGYQYASLDGDIVITFSEPMDSASLTGAVFQIDPVVPTSQVFGDSVLTVIPDNPLDSNTTYTATITTAAKDTAGNSFPADYAWQFATYRDTTPPVSSILSPVNNTVVGDSVRIEVTATDSDGIARVEFYADGTPITDAVDSIPPYEYIWTAESLELCSVHELHTVAYDSNVQ